jgi:hypothetical protein
LKHGQQQALIEASPQECFDAITDGAGLRPYGAACGLRRGASRLRRLELGSNQRSEARRSEARHSPAMTFEEQDDGRTLATYSVALDAGVWMPGPIRKVLSDQVMKRSVDDLKRRVESLTR